MKKYYFFVGLLICMLTGCGNYNTAEGETDQNIVDFPENYNKTIENVVFNTNIVINRNSENQTLYETTATIQKKDNDKAYEVLFDDVDSKKAADIDRADGKEIYYQGTNGESLFITPYTLFMSKTLYPYSAMLSVLVALIGFLPLNFISVKSIIEIIIIFFCICIMILFAPSRNSEESNASESYSNQCWKEFIVLSIVVCSYIISFLYDSSLHFVIFRSLLTAALSFIISLFQNDRI